MSRPPDCGVAGDPIEELSRAGESLVEEEPLEPLLDDASRFLFFRRVQYLRCALASTE